SLALIIAMSNPAFSMEIRQFDKMSIEDQGDYLALLVGGAEKVLRDAGRAPDADKVEHLFTTTVPGDTLTIGSVEFERNLAILRAADSKHAVDHPDDPRVEVEDAMFQTLKKNHIQLPDSFFTVAKDFKPKHSRRKQ